MRINFEATEVALARARTPVGLRTSVLSDIAKLMEHCLGLWRPGIQAAQTAPDLARRSAHILLPPKKKKKKSFSAIIRGASQGGSPELCCLQLHSFLQGGPAAKSCLPCSTSTHIKTSCCGQVLLVGVASPAVVKPLHAASDACTASLLLTLTCALKCFYAILSRIRIFSMHQIASFAQSHDMCVCVCALLQTRTARAFGLCASLSARF